MAKDRIKIYVGEVTEINALNLNSKYWMNIKKHKQDTGYWRCSIREYYIQYSLIEGSRNYGYLNIDFSISKLLNANNAIPATKINITKLIDKICFDLKEVINLNKVPNVAKWTISKDETFLDVIAPKEVVDSINHVIEYSKIPNRKTDTTYKNKGTIYIHSGSERNRASFTLIAYDKVREGAKRGHDIANIKGLKEGEGCLRLEIKTKLYSLKKAVKEFKDKHKLDELNSIYHNTKYIDTDIDQIKGFFTYVFDPHFQADVLFSILNDLHLLGKKILSRNELFDFINSSKVFNSPTKKENAIKAVRMLNGERVRNKLKPRTLTEYRKQLLDLGVHYVYVKNHIPKITKDMLEKAIYETGNLVIV